MNAPTSKPWEEALASLLDDLASVQEDLLQVLKEKRECMIQSDLEGMARLQPREQALCERLESFQSRRRALLEDAAADGLEAENLEELAGVLEKGRPGGLRKQVKGAAARMRLVQQSSLTNWVVAQRSLLHLAQLLEIIATGGRGQPTYGKDRSAPVCGALVDREA